jgi:hypothetical protein
MPGCPSSHGSQSECAKAVQCGSTQHSAHRCRPLPPQSRQSWRRVPPHAATAGRQAASLWHSMRAGHKAALHFQQTHTGVGPAGCEALHIASFDRLFADMQVCEGVTPAGSAGTPRHHPAPTPPAHHQPAPPAVVPVVSGKCGGGNHHWLSSSTERLKQPDSNQQSSVGKPPSRSTPAGQHCTSTRTHTPWPPPSALPPQPTCSSCSRSSMSTSAREWWALRDRHRHTTEQQQQQQQQQVGKAGALPQPRRGLGEGEGLPLAAAPPPCHPCCLLPPQCCHIGGCERCNPATISHRTWCGEQWGPPVCPAAPQRHSSPPLPQQSQRGHQRGMTPLLPLLPRPATPPGLSAGLPLFPPPAAAAAAAEMRRDQRCRCLPAQL